MRAMNNPIGNMLMQMIGMTQRGGNPLQMMQQMAGNNPQIAMAMKMIQGKSPAQLRQMAENMARERGTSIEEVARGLGLPTAK